MRRSGVLVVLAGLAMVAGCGNGSEGAATQTGPTVSEGPSTPSTPTASTTPVTTTPSASATVSAAEARRLGLRAVAALKRDDPERALALIAAGADVNARDGILDSVFLYAGAEGYADVVAAALAHGADTRVLNRYGGTALIPAAEHAHLDVIRLLLDNSDVAVDHVNDLGWTALGEAVALGNGDARHVQAVRLLLAAGADPDATDRFGRTVRENAERLGFTEIARVLAATPAG